MVTKIEAQRTASHTVAPPFGIIVGLAGILHGVFEIRPLDFSAAGSCGEKESPDGCNRTGKRWLNKSKPI